MILRDYQQAAVNSIFEYFMDSTGNPLVALPTGTGKSVIIGDFIKRACLTYPGQRIMQLTHVKELISQNCDTLLRQWPTAPAGVYSAGLNRKESEYPITFAGIASVVNKAEQFDKVDLVLIDEAHLVPPRGDTMYRRFLRDLKKLNPYLKIIGFTATPFRLGQGMLTDAGGIFTDLCFDLTSRESFNWLLDEGYLSPLIPRNPATQLDVSEVSINHGEYNKKELQEAVDQEEITYCALQEMMDLGGDRDHWLIFASGVKHAVNIALMLESLGISATFVHASMSGKERDRNIADFKAGKYRAMVNNGILTTGFDFPAIDLIGMLRPTQSPGLWIQMLGRGTRPVYASGYDLTSTEGRLQALRTGGKRDCLVLDFAGNTARLGPINDPIIPRPKGKGTVGVAPVKLCEQCECYNHASVRICIYCGSEFPVVPKIYTQASTGDLIRRNETDAPIVEKFNVDRVVYNIHTKADRPPSLKVSYYCGLRVFHEWVCLEHEGFVLRKAHRWWSKRSAAPLLPPPGTVREALTRMNELLTPCSINVWVNKKYPEILDHYYTNPVGDEEEEEVPF